MAVHRLADNMRDLVVGGALAEGTYECARCGCWFTRRRQVCRFCGSGHLDRREW